MNAKKFEKKNYPEVKIYKMDEQLGKTINKEPQEASMKDSGERKTFHTGAVRDVQGGKGRCDLLPACAILRLAKHYEAGAEKYEERNWEKGIPMHSFLDSALRHILKYLDGQIDEDHLCAAAWNLMGAMWTEEKRPELQDIPIRKKAEGEMTKEMNEVGENEEI